MAARRVARELGLANNYVVADARYLPFPPNWADVVFAYSVLQHFSKENVAIALGEAARVLKPNGTSIIQMPTTLGVRCLFHQAKRGFRKPRGFEVRYWGIHELKKAFGKIIGRSSISVDCYFGIGIQKSDFGLMPLSLKIVTVCSEGLRALSKIFPFLVYAADSVYVESRARKEV
jgi:SAM-dependent methyltransferase